MTRYFVRFTPWQRAQHVIVLMLFVLLCVTGLPQKYFESGWAAWMLGVLGGVDSARWVHRASGIVFTALLVAHVGDQLVRLARGTASTRMVPHRKDVTDAITTLRYYVGLSSQQARFDRYDYKQKFEYWGLIFGALIMALTGFILFFPILLSRVLPAELIPAAKVMHSAEALLAFLIVLIWHMAGAHLTPESFPMDTSIFTGKIRKEKLRREHTLEYEDLFGKQ